MYICIARIRKTPLTHCQRNANNRQTGGFQSPSKLLWSNSWIAQTVRQWIPGCRTSRSEGTATKGAAADVEHSVDGRSQVPATGNIGHWNAVVDEVHRCLIPETPVDGHGKLVLHSLRDVDVQPVQFVRKLVRF